MAIWHPTEDELIHHMIDDTDSRERRRIQGHLIACEDCRRTSEEITESLTLVDASVPEPPAGFERVMWARVQQAISEAPRESWLTSFGWRQWLPIGSFAGLAIVGIALANRPGEPASKEPVPTTTAAAVSDEKMQERVLLTALDSHFQQMEMLLVEVRNASERDPLEFESVSAEDLVSAGRFYRQTAEHTGEQRLMQVLDEVEPVLMEVARNSERLTPGDRQWLRTRIDSDALLFKVRAAASDVRERVVNPD
jgi:hypothetical protein